MFPNEINQLKKSQLKMVTLNVKFLYNFIAKFCD